MSPDALVHRLPRRAAAVLLAGTLLLTGTGAALAQGGGSSPDPGSGGVPSPLPSLGPITFDDNAIPVVPKPGSVTDPQPTPWDHVTIAPDGRRLTVFWWSGAEACYGLDRIELMDVDGTLSITPYTGFRVDAAAVRCAEMAQLYSTVVTLETPILGGGLPGMEGQALAPTEAEVLLPGATLMQSEPQPWERVQVGPDGRSLWVWFTGGAEPCYGLGSVELKDVGGTPTLVLQAGMTDSLAMCIAVAVTYRTPVAIPDPLILGGLV